MATYLVIKLLLLGILLLVPIQGIKGCPEEERRALLEFKAFVKSEGHDADYLLPSWVNDPNDDCCKWERVVCNSTTGRTVNLSLDNVRQFDIHSPSLYDKKNRWYLNTSLFHPFKELRSLNLSANGIAGWIQDQESPIFQNLLVLDLGFNNVSGPPSSTAQVQATGDAGSSHLLLRESSDSRHSCNHELIPDNCPNLQCCTGRCRDEYRSYDPNAYGTFNQERKCWCYFLSNRTCPTLELLPEFTDLVRSS